MNRRRTLIHSILVAASLSLVTVAFARAASVQQKSTSGWTLPPDAAETKSPLTVDDKVLAIGKKVFTDQDRKSVV